MTLEKLLNILCEKGWKPFGINYYCSFNIRERIEIIGGPFGGGEYILERIISLRELCSKESGLWQFVCENGMIEDKGEIRYKADENNDLNDANYMGEFYYWLLESSLKDESELEQFLLDNIKVGND